MRPLILPLLLLGSCASYDGSYVDASTPPGVQRLASAIVSVVDGSATGKQIVLGPLPGDQETNVVTPELVTALRAESFIMVEEGAPVLVYQVTPLVGGTVLRVRFNGTQASLFFANDDAGALVPSGPYVMRGVAR